MNEERHTPDDSCIIYETPENHAVVNYYPNGSLANPVERAAWQMYRALAYIIESGAIDVQYPYAHELAAEAITKARGGHDYMKVCQRCSTTVCYDETGKEYVCHDRSPFLCQSCAMKIMPHEF